MLSSGVGIILCRCAIRCQHTFIMTLRFRRHGGGVLGAVEYLEYVCFICMDEREHVLIHERNTSKFWVDPVVNETYVDDHIWVAALEKPS